MDFFEDGIRNRNKMGRTQAPQAKPQLASSARVAMRTLAHFTQLDTAELAAVLASSGALISAANFERDLADAGRPLEAPLDAYRASWYVAAAVALWDGGDDAPVARVLRSALQARDASFPSAAEYDRQRDRLEKTIREDLQPWAREALNSLQYADSDWPPHFAAVDSEIAGSGTRIVRGVGKKRPSRRRRNTKVWDRMDALSQAPRSWSAAERDAHLSNYLRDVPHWTVGDSFPTSEVELFAIFLPSLQRKLIRDFLIALKAAAKETLPTAIRERDATIRRHSDVLCSPGAPSPEPAHVAVEALSAYRRARSSAAALLKFRKSKAREQRLSIGERELLERLIYPVERLGTVLMLPPNCKGPLATFPRDQRARLFLAWYPK